jgi:hypothetical protein
MDPEHISKPIKRVLEVIYEGNDWEASIDKGLKELGINAAQIQTIICIPAEMAGDKDRQRKLFK